MLLLARVLVLLLLLLLLLPSVVPQVPSWPRRLRPRRRNRLQLCPHPDPGKRLKRFRFEA